MTDESVRGRNNLANVKDIDLAIYLFNYGNKLYIYSCVSVAGVCVCV